MLGGVALELLPPPPGPLKLEISRTRSIPWTTVVLVTMIFGSMTKAELMKMLPFPGTETVIVPSSYFVARVVFPPGATRLTSWAAVSLRVAMWYFRVFNKASASLVGKEALKVLSKAVFVGAKMVWLSPLSSSSSST
jgi:hypothetical protein